MTVNMKFRRITSGSRNSKTFLVEQGNFGENTSDLLVISKCISLFLAYFPKVCLCSLRSPSVWCICVSVCSPSINFWIYELIIMKFTIYIKATKPIWTIRFINPFHQSVLKLVSLLCLQDNDSVKSILRFGVRQLIGEKAPAAMNTRNNKIIVGRIIFYEAHVSSKERLWACLCILL
jgi:hypothetical protein